MSLVLPTLPTTQTRWREAGCPDVFTEIRAERSCWLVGSLEPRLWPPEGRLELLTRVRHVLPATLAHDRSGPVPDPSAELSALAARAAAQRRKRFGTCVGCQESVPPEYLDVIDGQRVCIGCASTFGVIY